MSVEAATATLSEDELTEGSSAVHGGEAAGALVRLLCPAGGVFACVAASSMSVTTYALARIAADA
jgi:hypothetical protein